jgi:hypothetical protein
MLEMVMVSEFTVKVRQSVAVYWQSSRSPDHFFSL